MKKIFHLCVLACVALATATLPMGCGNSKSSPSSPSSPAPTFNYSLDYFFGHSGTVTMYSPLGIRLSGGTLWVANNGDNDLEAWTTAGVLSEAVTSIDGVTAFGGPTGIGIGPDGDVYVTDSGNGQVEVFAPTGQGLQHFGKPLFSEAHGVAVNATYAYVADLANAQVIRFTISGSGISRTFVSPVTFGTLATSGALGALNTPNNLCLDSQGNVYVSDQGLHEIVKFNSSGGYLSTIAVTGLYAPYDVQVDGSGYIYVADHNNSLIRILNSSGTQVASFGDAYSLTYPDGLALDGSGNIYVLNDSSDQVVVYNKQ